MKEPKTFQEAILYFADRNRCIDYLALRRWLNGMPVCPVCGRTDAPFLEKQGKWQCKAVHHHRQFSVKVGTVMEDSAIPLEKWLPAIWALVNDKNGISSWELHRMLGVTQKAAWFMLHRIRVGLGAKNDGTKIGNKEGGGGVEVDETFVGGRLQNMHKDRKLAYQIRGGAKGKTVVMGMLDRDLRQVRAKIVPNVKRETLQAEVMR